MDIPEEILELERRAWAEIREGRLSVASADAVQDAVTAFAAEQGLSRLDVEAEVKKRVRHPEA